MLLLLLLFQQTSHKVSVCVCLQTAPGSLSPHSPRLLPSHAGEAAADNFLGKLSIKITYLTSVCLLCQPSRCADERQSARFLFPNPTSIVCQYGLMSVKPCVISKFVTSVCEDQTVQGGGDAASTSDMVRRPLQAVVALSVVLLCSSRVCEGTTPTASWVILQRGFSEYM